MTPLSEDPRERRSHVRLIVLAGAFVLVFAGLAFRAATLAAAPAPGSAAPLLAAAEEGARRGDLVDRHGEILATSLEAYSLYADPEQVWDAEETAQALATVLPRLDAAELASRLDSNRRFIWVRRGLSPRQRQAVFELGLPGLGFRREPRRVYPRGQLAAHALGFTTIDGDGAAGAERAFDEALSAGETVALTLDLRVQYALEDALSAAQDQYRASAALGVVTDVRTGEILAMASSPTFDPNQPAEASAEERRNRTAAAVYELGSIFKTFTVAIALDAGVTALDAILPTSDGLSLGALELADPGRARDMSVAQVFVRSSNVGAALLALATGEDRQRAYLERLGLLARAPLELAESAAPLLPSQWNEVERATLSYGYGLAVSPVSFMAAFGAVANGGEYLPPRLRLADPDTPLTARRALSEQTSAAMLRLLRLAVERGTGVRADVPGYLVAGKTGTAERAASGGYDPDRLVSSFAAVFPYDEPRYAVLITLEDPQGAEEDDGRASAGYTAAPTTAAVIARIAPVLGVARRDDPLLAALREAG